MENNLFPILAQDGGLTVVSVDGQPVVTARVLAEVLGYAHERSVRILHNRNKESFRERESHFDAPLRYGGN